MSSYGIMRRIDELGRIVIPKELRRTLRIKEGDEMQIFAENDAIILKKYSGFESVLPAAKAVAKLLRESTDADVLFVSPTDVVIAEGKDKKEYSDLKLHEDFSQIIRSRKSAVLHGDDLKKIFEGRECECSFAVSEPVVVGGDLVGAMVLLLDALPSDIARAYLGFCAQLIAAALS